jgi:glyoxylate reductase
MEPMTKQRRPEVFVTRRIADTAIAHLAMRASVEVWEDELPPPREELAARLAIVDGILSMVTDRLDAAALAHAPNLRVISNLAVGVDNIDLATATKRGIAVGHTPGVLTETTTDFAFALLMATARRVVEADRYVHGGRWQAWGPRILLGNDVWGATLGIIGWGAIGQTVARRAAGFGMRVLFTSRHPAAEAAPGTRVELDELLRSADFVSIHVALTDQTRHVIGRRELTLMKRGAILINTARGPIVDQRALADALASGHLGGAGLDVTEVEPIDASDPLLSIPNVVITPHIGSASHATRAKMAEIAVDSILAVFEGRMPPFCANPEVKLAARRV